MDGADPTQPTAETEPGGLPTRRLGPGGIADPEPGASYGRFVVEGLVGTGGMGVVLLARDPELDRRVALKVLHPEVWAGDEAAPARLLREAQAMARLSHPNVVTVYEVGRAGAQVFVAMELVEGDNLRDWLRDGDRPWRDVLAMFVGAGRGLAAAHAAGLVHRDVKPDNILVGAGGRARVTDFGLVASGGAAPLDEVGSIDGARLSSGLTLHGSAVGTPAYMSAEQWCGDAVDARSDQFSFCVALWEGLYGARPFAGSTAAEQARRVRVGEITPPPPKRGVPGWVEAALRRGLAVDPARRWPSLTALLDHLERRAGAGRRSLKIAGLIAAPIVVGALVFAATTRAEAPEACPAPDRRLAAVWGPARRAALGDRLPAIDPALGAARFDAAAAAFDVGAASWRDAHVAACRATRVDGEQSDTTLDLRMRCLDRWLRELDGTIAIVERAGDRKAVDQAIVAARQMSPLAGCADSEALASAPPPDGTEAQGEARAIEDELDGLRLAGKSGALDGTLARSRALVERARALGHPPTLAAALEGAAASALALEDGSSAALLEELTRAAAVARDDQRAAYAWVKLIQVRGLSLDQPHEAEVTLASAEAALLRAGDPPGLRLDLLITRVGLLGEAGRAAEARGLLDQADRVLAAADPAALDSSVDDYRSKLLFARARAAEASRDPAAAEQAYRDAIALRRQLFGDHPDVARALVNLGEVLRQQSKGTEALAAYEEAARIAEARVGESALLAVMLDRRGLIYYEQEQSALALPLFERAVAVGAAALGPDHPTLADLLSDQASALRDLGRLGEALAIFDRALAINERGGHRTSNVAIGHFNRGNVLSGLGRWAEAFAAHQRAVAMMEELAVDEHYLIPFLFAIGRDLVNGGRPAEAIAPLERALTIPTPGMGAEYKIVGRFMLGRARVDSGRARRTGLAEARQARSELDLTTATPETLAEMDAWLARHQAPRAAGPSGR